MSSAGERGKHRNRPLLVTLLPGDEICFRPKGTRAKYTVYLGHCFRLAQALTIEQNYKDALQRYQARRKAGETRIRKPKRPMIPFNKIYFEATKST